ncbi:HD domain-containing protein [Streptomyces sp. MK37H]|uniref:HD domain-containing protein n=1 Tax=Streptomyces sp. MK37H TaxID=2699117 RepID=UPI0027E57F70|nr:HD domain-containing protein [Streptomyces sp. MK37H]
MTPDPMYPAETTAVLHVLDASTWPEADRSRAKEAAALALTAYADHARDQGTPYIDHPLAVVSILRAELAVTAPNTLLLGLLHDALEVSPSAAPLLTTRLGADFVTILQAMTPDHRLEQRTKQLGDKAAWRAKTSRLAPEPLLVRLADRIHNLRDLRNSPNADRRERFITALIEFYLPLAESARPISAQLNAACSLLQAEYERYQHRAGKAGT